LLRPPMKVLLLSSLFCSYFYRRYLYGDFLAFCTWFLRDFCTGLIERFYNKLFESCCMGRTYTGISPYVLDYGREYSREVRRNSNPAHVKAREEVQKVWYAVGIYFKYLETALYFYQVIHSLRDRQTVETPYNLR
jgi:hypothetical protein